MVRDGYQINTIAVGPQHQGKGIGGALLRYACREADEQGLTMTLACQEQRLVCLGHLSSRVTLIMAGIAVPQVRISCHRKWIS